MEYDIAVIGGGASGLMAAGTAVKLGKKVVLVEQNRFLAKKVRITGKGRCNVTNICDREEFLGNVLRGNKFLYSAFSKFSNYDCMSFFEDLGVPLKIERGGRVFPASDNAHDIVQALMRHAEGAEKRSNCKVLGVEGADGAFNLRLEKNATIEAKSMIIATGGASYPGTGSTGDGYDFAKALGHEVIDPEPSLVPFVTAEKWVKDLEGLSLKNVGVRLVKGGKAVFENGCGEMLFTDFGVSGPVILSASAHACGGQFWDGAQVELFIDLKPALDEDVLDARILRDFSENVNKDFVNALDGLLPKSMVPIIIELSGIDSRKKVNQITKEERTKLVKLLKGLKLTVVSTRPIDEAIVTAGGVSTREINPSTMESKLVEGLYFAGEVIDLDAYTGGFNLQIAFSTGYVAGENA
jgi:hypothetical protein